MKTKQSWNRYAVSLKPIGETSLEEAVILTPLETLPIGSTIKIGKAKRIEREITGVLKLKETRPQFGDIVYNPKV